MQFVIRSLRGSMKEEVAIIIEDILSTVSYTHLDVYKRQAVDSIILGISTGCSGDSTREGALLTKNVIELEHDGKRLAPVSYTHLHW